MLSRSQPWRFVDSKHSLFPSSPSTPVLTISISSFNTSQSPALELWMVLPKLCSLASKCPITLPGHNHALSGVGISLCHFNSSKPSHCGHQGYSCSSVRSSLVLVHNTDLYHGLDLRHGRKLIYIRKENFSSLFFIMFTWTWVLSEGFRQGELLSSWEGFSACPCWTSVLC